MADDDLSAMQRNFLEHSAAIPQRVTSEEGRAAVEDLVARGLGRTFPCRSACGCPDCADATERTYFVQTDQSAPDHDGAQLRPGRYRAAVRYFCDLVGQLGTEGVDELTLQDTLTEIHIACWMVDPTLDFEHSRYDKDMGRSLLHVAAELLREHLDRSTSEDLCARTRTLLDRADPVVNPREADDDEDEHFYEDEPLEDP